MHRIQAGDHGALDEALEKYWEPLVRYAYGSLGNRDGAEDSAQEAFVRLWQHRAEWCAQGSLRGYLYRILRNYLHNERRAMRVRARWRDRALRRERRGPLTPIEFVERSELSDAVGAALSALPPRRREIFSLSRVHGLSYQEIAETLGISPQTVANQMSAALSTLREQLARFRPTATQPHLRLVRRDPTS
jgi:RNA polymerase sigma-70 factor, ECF subfamily